jgi:hypothetical protein
MKVLSEKRMELSQTIASLSGSIRVATKVPNVKQVVNDLQVKNQKATSSQ